MAEANRARRRHSAEFKQRVLAECDRPGASVAAVALSHSLSDNLVHKWRQQARRSGAVQVRNDAFIPLEMNRLPTGTDGPSLRIPRAQDRTSVAVGLPAWLR